jgi:hypothetical protein
MGVGYAFTDFAECPEYLKHDILAVSGTSRQKIAIYGFAIRE